MGWLTLNQGKLTEVQNVANLESRLTYITRTLQATHHTASYDERELGAQKADALNELDTNHTQDLKALAEKYSMTDLSGAITSGNSSVFEQLANYNLEIKDKQLEFLSAKKETLSIFNQKEQDLQDRTFKKEQSLNTQQEMTEDLLKAARANFQALSDAVATEAGKTHSIAA